MKIRDIKTREDIPRFLNNHRHLGIGVEIGVNRGRFSLQLLKLWKGKKLYLVDSWRHVADYSDTTNVSDQGHLFNLMVTLKAVRTHRDRVAVICEESAKASSLFLDGSLDFAYIDANHTYESVMKDLSCWAPKVKDGGILCGHDFFDSPKSQVDGADGFGVKKAVTKWAASRGYRFHVTGEKKCPSWIIKI